MSPSISSPKPPPRAFRPFPFAYHEEVELRIETLTNMGQGLARVDLSGRVGAATEGAVVAAAAMEDAADGGAGEGSAGKSGWVVMVPFALPGELVRARIFRNQKNFSEADLVAVLEPSLARVAPRCALFGVWRLPVPAFGVCRSAAMETPAGG